MRHSDARSPRNRSLRQLRVRCLTVPKQPRSQIASVVPSAVGHALYRADRCTYASVEEEHRERSRPENEGSSQAKDEDSDWFVGNEQRHAGCYEQGDPNEGIGPHLEDRREGHEMSADDRHHRHWNEKRPARSRKKSRGRGDHGHLHSEDGREPSSDSASVPSTLDRLSVRRRGGHPGDGRELPDAGGNENDRWCHEQNELPRPNLRTIDQRDEGPCGAGTGQHQRANSCAEHETATVLPSRRMRHDVALTKCRHCVHTP